MQASRADSLVLVTMASIRSQPVQQALRSGSSGLKTPPFTHPTLTTPQDPTSACLFSHWGDQPCSNVVAQNLNLVIHQCCGMSPIHSMPEGLNLEF